MLTEFMSRYMEWKGLRKELKGQEARDFARWLARAQPAVLQAAPSPAAFRLQCIEVQRMFDPRPEVRVGPSTLAKYAGDLIRAYRHKPRQETYQTFLNRALGECSSAKALSDFIRREGAN